MAHLMFPRQALSATLLTALLWPSSTLAGFSPDPPIMTTLSLTILSATIGAGMGGIILAQDRERHLRDHAVELLDDLATRDTTHLLELAVLYVEPARREAFVNKLLKSRELWMTRLAQLVRGECLVSELDRALVAL